MSFRGYMLLFTGLVFGGALFSQAQKDGSSKKPVDIKADVAYRTPQLEDNAIVMVGNVVFHHNGAVISCDSAVRYSDRRIDCFKNVIINQDSTFVYGDRAEYNGEMNLARVYSPVVKVVDGDATLYTYNFSFNTQTNIGRWYGGGVMYQKDNVLESESGYFYSDLHELVAVRGVEMKNDSHQIISDSVAYNTETKLARFFTKTYIWTKDGEIITADKGHYNTQDSTYFFHDNAYVLTEFRETWADTIDFNARTEDALFYGNIQIDDNENESSAFGDFGQYWGERGETVLTKRPSILNYSEDQGNRDTMYMSADTMFMYVIYPSDSRRNDSLPAASEVKEAVDHYAHLRWTDTLPDSVKIAMADSLELVIADLKSGSDSLAGITGRADSLLSVVKYIRPKWEVARLDSLAAARADSLGRIDSLAAADSIFSADPKALKKHEKALAKAEKKAAKAEKRLVKAGVRAAKKAEKQRLRAEKRAAKKAEKAAKIADRRRRVAEKRGWVTETPYSDSLAWAADSIARMDSLMRLDSLMPSLIDSLEKGPAPDTTAARPDTTMRIFRGWYNVKIWRTDMQAVCDSMVGFSMDSTVHMYTDPVLWNGESQIVADSITLRTAAEKVDRAEFYGDPIMSSQLSTGQFNQVTGRTMTSYFRDSEVYRHDADGNAQALYYMQEDGNPEPVALIVASSATMTFLLEADSLRYIVARDQVDWPVYPIDQIPPTQPVKLKGFEWFIERKPELKDVFDRRVRPTERALYDTLSRPEFPIAARIDRRREYLINNRMWGDRTDPLPDHAVEFVRSLEQ